VLDRTYFLVFFVSAALQYLSELDSDGHVCVFLWMQSSPL